MVAIVNKSEMTSKERLWAALSRQPPDRVPIYMLFPRERLDCYVDVHTLPSYAQVTPEVWQKTDWLDRRSIPSAPFHTAASNIESHVEQRGEFTVRRSVLHTPLGDLTAEHRSEAKNASGATVEHYCKDISDLDKILSIPYEPVDPDMGEYLRAAGELGDAGLMMVSLGMPVGVAYGAAHPQDFALWTLTELDTLKRFTQVFFERQYTWMKKALDAGAGPVWFCVGTEFVAPPLCSPKAFDTLVKPYDGALFDLIHQYGGRVIVHHHGNISAILERIADVGADGIQPIEEPPIGDCTMAAAKARIGDRVCLVGSVQYDDIERLSPDELEELIHRQIRDAAEGGGMILAPTAGPYAAELPPRQQTNYIRFIEAGLRWGRYPLR
jgi:hypothetical protein